MMPVVYAEVMVHLARDAMVYQILVSSVMFVVGVEATTQLAEAVMGCQTARFMMPVGNVAAMVQNVLDATLSLTVARSLTSA